MWFDGSVAEAVDKSKREKKLFMVFIEGKDDLSKGMADILNNLREDILTVMQREVVAIKVEDGSENCKLFGKIYPILMVPSTYFISNTGVNLEIIPGKVSEQEFMDRLDKVLIVHKAGLTQPPVPPIVSPVTASPLSQSATVSPASQPQKSAPATVSHSSLANTTVNSPLPAVSSAPMKKEASNTAKQPKLDDKVVKAQQLLEQIKIKKAKEEEEKARQQELDRIRTAKEMAKAKAKREEMEIAELVKEREKEKREAAEARKRILAQIEADKQERRRRMELFRPTEASCSNADPKPGPSSEKNNSSAKANENETRIQFRFPDGTYQNQTFGADDPLCALRQYVIDTTSYRNFTLSTSYPKKTFTNNDMTMSLRELELTPSSVILVLISPSVVSKATSIVSANIFTQVWALIMTPLFWLWTFVTSLFMPPPAITSAKASGDSAERKRSLEKEERERRLAKRQKESKLLNRDGNIARLRDNSDDKEDDGTWNGNSTQQM